MLWIVLATVPAFLWAFTNILDEFLAKEHFAKNGALLIFLSGVCEIVPAAFLFTVFVDTPVPLSHMLIVGGLGIILTCSFVPYIYALQLGNAKNATPIFQSIPVFVFVLGWAFLGETVTPIQMLAAAIIIISSVLIGFNFTTKSINHKAAALMLLSSFIIGCVVVASKYFIDLYGWAVVTAYSILGSSLFCMILVSLYRPFRRKSVATLSAAGPVILFLFFLQIFQHITALSLYNSALEIAPSAALVSTVSGSQPAFVLILAILAGLTASQHFPKIHFDRILVYKFFMIGVLIFGIYLLMQS